MTQFSAEQMEILRPLVTRIQLDMRSGKLPPGWGGPVFDRALAAVKEHKK